MEKGKVKMEIGKSREEGRGVDGERVDEVIVGDGKIGKADVRAGGKWPGGVPKRKYFLTFKYNVTTSGTCLSR